jgi:UDP-4-amino-4,6-dideoxy-N-acetyl-beta-L-altrosamine transaminase
MNADKAHRIAAVPRVLGYGRHLIDDADIAAVVDVLRGETLTRGPQVERFEAVLAERVGARYCVAVSSGTAALHIACLAAGMKPGSAGLTTPLTFVASANAMLYCGGEATFADIDPDALGLAPDAVRAALEGRPEIAVVMPVHFAGLARHAAALRQLSGSRIVIEDACHSLGGAYEDGKEVGCGAYADMTVFSFHPVKPITTAEGGAVMTNDPALYRLLRLLRCHGIERIADRLVNRDEAFEGDAPNPWCAEQHMLGFNYRMSDLQAALGLSQLAKLDRFRMRRRDISRAYDAAFSALPDVRIPQSSAADRARSAHHLYVLCIDFPKRSITRKRVMEQLAAHGVGSQVHYLPVHRQPFHQVRAGFAPVQLPVADAHYRDCLSLPLHPGLTDDEVERVIRAVVLTIGEAC